MIVSAKQNLFRAALALLLVSVICLASAPDAVAGDPPRVEVMDNPPAQPDFVFTSMTEGEELRLADLRGQLVMVHYWATWCAPCIVELPHIDDLSADYADKAFTVVAVSTDKKRKNLRRFLKRAKLKHLTPWWDRRGESYDIYDEDGIPFTVFYGGDGQELVRIRGNLDWSDAKAREIIDGLIRQESANG